MVAFAAVPFLHLNLADTARHGESLVRKMRYIPVDPVPKMKLGFDSRTIRPTSNGSLMMPT